MVQPQLQAFPQKKKNLNYKPNGQFVWSLSPPSQKDNVTAHLSEPLIKRRRYHSTVGDKVRKPAD